MTFDVLPNLGNGMFVDPPVVALDAQPSGGGAFFDVNGDGRTDALVPVDSIPNQSYVDVYLNQGVAGFVKAGRVTLTDRAMGFVFGDFTGDGKIDAIARTSYSDILLLTGDGAGHFTQTGSFYGPPDSFGLAVGNANAAGDDELLVSAPGGIRAYDKQPGGFFGGTARMLTDSGSPALRAITDVDGDGKPDLLVSGLFSGGIGFAKSLGGFSFATPATIGPNITVHGVLPLKMGALPRRWLVAGDDGIHDVAESASGTTYSLVPGPRGGLFLPTEWSGDGVRDIVLAGATIALYRGNADGSFTWSGMSLLGGGSANAADVFDATGDGKPDVVVIGRYGGLTVLPAGK